MKVLITGASGFLGRNLLLKAPEKWDVTALYYRSEDFTRFLRENGLGRVKALKCDLTDAGSVSMLSKKIGGRFDLIVYLAGSTDPRRSVTEPIEDFRSNVMALLNFLLNFRCGKMVYFSSGAVYDGLKGLVGPDSRPSPSLPYAISKLTAENYVRQFQEMGKDIREYVIVRFFGAYGPYEPERKIYSRLLKAFSTGNSFTIRGNGKNYIDAMYIDDAMRGLLSIIETKTPGSMTVDFGTGNPVTINQLAETAASVMEVRHPDIRHEGETAEYISFRISDERMRKTFSFSPEISLEEGLNRFARHMGLK